MDAKNNQHFIAMTNCKLPQKSYCQLLNFKYKPHYVLGVMQVNSCVQRPLTFELPGTYVGENKNKQIKKIPWKGYKLRYQ